ncbi:hypothetical protein Tco_0995027 [Tanacetum coccineum]
MSANDDFSLHDDEELSLHDDASLAGSVPASNKGDAPAKPPQIITTNTLSNIKLPGNFLPTTQAEQVADEKERKARTLLLMAVPKDHLRRVFMAWMMPKNLGSYQDKESLEKGYDRFQKLLSQLDALGASVSDEDANHKFLRECKFIGTKDGKAGRKSIKDRFHASENEKEALMTIDGYEEEMDRGIFASIRETDPGYHAIPLYSRFKQVENKGVPHPLSGDYTPREQEDIDDSLNSIGNDMDLNLKLIILKCLMLAPFVFSSSAPSNTNWKSKNEEQGEAALKSKRVVNTNDRQATATWKNTIRINKANQFTPDLILMSVHDNSVLNLMSWKFSMAQLKYCDKHNQVGFLLKPTESAGYTEIVDFLRRSKLRYALTHNPPIYDSLVKQFWQTATARTLADGTQQLDATIDTIEYTITEESVRRQLQLADASGIHMLQNEEIFAGLQNIGSKSGGWDQFGSNIATALICLSTGRDFNFSKLIFDGMISNLKSKSKFLMYPRFLQMILNVQTENKNLFVPVSLTKKIFGNMKRGFQGIHRPLLPAMLTIDAGQPQPSAAPTPTHHVSTPSSSHVQITQPQSPPPPITATPPPQPPPQPSSVQPTLTTPPIQPVETTSSPPMFTIPDTQPTPPPSPQVPSPSYHDTEGPSFEPSYHMSPPPSHEPEFQASRSSEESEQLRNLMDIVPRLESRVKSLEKELSETKQTLL